MPVWGQAFIFGLGGMLVLMGLGVPIAFALGLIGFAGFLVFSSPQMALNFINIISYSAPPNLTLAAVPLFVLMAELLVVTRVGEAAYSSVAKLLSGLPGSLAIATNGAGTLLGAVMGSSAASCATLGRIGLPEMKRHGYSNVFAAGAIAGAGGLAVIIPPSITAIIYAFVMEQSVIKMFAAGIFPGLLMATGYISWVVLKAKMHPEEAPLVPSLPMGERLLGGVHVLPIILLIGIVLGSIYSGTASVTESAAFGVVGALLVGLYYHRRAKGTWRDFGDGLRGTAATTSFIMLIVVGAFYFSQFWVYTGVTKKFAEYMLGLNVSPLMLLIVTNFGLLILGCIMDTLSLLIVVIPILARTLMLMGMDPIWVGNIYLINMEMALLTPPVGFNLFVVKGLGERYGMSFAEISKGAFPYVVVDCIVIGLVIAFPELALWAARALG